MAVCLIMYHVQITVRYHDTSWYNANFVGGEIIEWTGFAIACWSLPAAAFAIMTFCNLGPRAHHVCF